MSEKTDFNPFYVVKDEEKAQALAVRAIEREHFFILASTRFIFLPPDYRTKPLIAEAADFLVNKHDYMIRNEYDSY